MKNRYQLRKLSRLAKLRRLEKYDPSNVNIKSHIVGALMDLGWYDLAIRKGKQCLGITKKYIRQHMLFSIALSLSSVGKDKLALKYFRQCSRLPFKREIKKLIWWKLYEFHSKRSVNKAAANRALKNAYRLCRDGDTVTRTTLDLLSREIPNRFASN